MGTLVLYLEESDGSAKLAVKRVVDETLEKAEPSVAVGISERATATWYARGPPFSQAYPGTLRVRTCTKCTHINVTYFVLIFENSMYCVLCTIF